MASLGPSSVTDTSYRKSVPVFVEEAEGEMLTTRSVAGSTWVDADEEGSFAPSDTVSVWLRVPAIVGSTTTITVT